MKMGLGSERGERTVKRVRRVVGTSRLMIPQLNKTVRLKPYKLKSNEAFASRAEPISLAASVSTFSEQSLDLE